MSASVFDIRSISFGLFHVVWVRKYFIIYCIRYECRVISVLFCLLFIFAFKFTSFLLNGIRIKQTFLIP